MKGSSQKGRDLQNMKYVASLTRDPVLWIGKAMQWAGKDALTPEIGLKSSEMAAAGCGEGYVNLVSGLKRSTPLQRTLGVWKAGLLTSPLTHAVNVVSTWTNLAAEIGKDVPASLMDMLISTETGKRTVAGPSVEQLNKGIEGAVEGVRDARDILRGKQSPEALAKLEFKAPLEFGNSLAGKVTSAYVNAVFRSLSAEDAIPRKAAFMRALQGEAELAGKSFQEASQDIGMVTRAVSDSEHATFQNDTKIGRGLKGAAQLPGGEIFIPFQK